MRKPIIKNILVTFLLLVNSLAMADLGSLSLYPRSLIQVPEGIEHVLVSELEAGVLHVYSRNTEGFTRTTTMPVSIGKSGFGKEVEGDNKTPVGVYRITSHLTEEQLDDFYGKSAYPINYPNSWDRLNGRTGYGIWFHAEPLGLLEKTRPKLDSNGCVVLSNNDIDILQQYLSVGYTPVILTPALQLVTRDKIAEKRQQLLDAVEAWRADWQSQQIEPYLAHYADGFSSIKQNLEQWKSHKTRINKAKSFIRVSLSDISIYDYPGEDDLVQVDFYQAYRSSNYNADGWKRQLWRLHDQQWKIVFEGNR